MRVPRLALALVTTAALLAAPVATPVWAAPRPVAPSLHRTPIGGVSQAALAASPAALDPDAATAAASAGRSQPSGRPSVPRVTASRRPAVFTEALDAGGFTAAGVTWRAGGAPAGVVVQIRVREHGAWSDWQLLALEGGPDANTVEAAKARSTIATQPYSTGSADAVQVRVDSAAALPPADLTLLTVDPGTSPADANLQGTPSGTARGATSQPAIVTRAQWGADESLRDCTPTYSSTLKVGFVHHTTGSNTYAAADSAAIVRGIYAYHVQGNGWCDLGYNLLVDRFGQTFEGRAGGIDRPVIGAHTLAFNANSFSVSAIGDFRAAAAPAAMTASIGRVLGWKLSLHDRDPHGTDRLTSAGGTGARWPAGTVVTFDVVSGHRDAYATECPGQVLYDQLAGLRDAASRYILANSGPSLVLTAQSAPLSSPDGRYRAVMQPDGNLVVYDAGGSAQWASSTSAPYSYAAVQGDGNLVVYDRVDGSARWTANTGGLGAHLEMQDDGNLVLYSAAGAQWDSRGYLRHPTITFPSVRRVIPSLRAEQSVSSPNGAYRLVMQGDGNLVEYGPSGARWATLTTVPGARLEVQPDGNLVVYTADDRVLWTSFTNDHPGAFALIADDGSLRLYTPAVTVLWRA